jgi:integrase/recombinase XerD
MLVAARLGSPLEHALISRLAPDGLRVSGGHRCRHRATSWSRVPDLDHTRKGGNVVTIPVAPRTARTIDLAGGKRCHGPILQAADGRRLDRHGAGRIVRWVARPAGISKAVTPHTRHAFISAGLDAGVPLRGAQGAASDADPRTTMRYYNQAVGQRGPACAGLVPHALGCP